VRMVDDGLVFGGRSVAKILVADDNSNIQKMVGLALKDHGIEVVAVGNGEAAVRKICDVHPDLVLADVFMPVRNGYEVCKYVKEDKALSHIPVILLVGAFDPLDEQEAQRAGADGVLKKPFVPPDPLISMVKSALVRAGVAHAGFTPAKAEPEAPARVAAPMQEAATAPKVPPLPPPFEVPQPIVPEETESFVDEVPARPAALKIESGEQPVAFGSLLETPSAATDEEAPELAAAPPGLRMEHDWRSGKDEEEGEGEEEPRSPSWRRDSADDEESFVEEGNRAASRDFRGGGQESWTPTREKADLTDRVEPVVSVPSGIMDRRDMPATVPFSGEAWAKAIDAGLDRKTAVVEEEQPSAHRSDLEQMIGQAPESLVTGSTPAVVVPEAPEDAEPVVTAAEHAEAVVEESPTSLVVERPAEIVHELPTVLAAQKLSTADSWFSTPPNPWEAEAQKASQLASSWETVATAPVVNESIRGDVSFGATSAPDEIEVVSGANSEIAAAAAETVREEASQAVEQAEHQMDANPAAISAREAVHDAAANLDMDAVVAKVLARINPGLLHEATREILKPVVEAVIREELHSKKS
jgi:CheY-like chemotaxis protein